jgi:hypothetical protein
MMRTVAVALVLLLTACQARPKVVVRDGCLTESMKIELVSFPGCPLAAGLRAQLEEATRGTGLTFIQVDQTLLGAGDPRRAFPAPTILVDGRDLFPAHVRHESEAAGIRCRSYPEGLPDAEAVRQALRRRGCP